MSKILHVTAHFSPFTLFKSPCTPSSSYQGAAQAESPAGRASTGSSKAGAPKDSPPSQPSQPSLTAPAPLLAAGKTAGCASLHCSTVLGNLRPRNDWRTDTLQQIRDSRCLQTDLTNKRRIYSWFCMRALHSAVALRHLTLGL